jgi:hypothetical protein
MTQKHLSPGQHFFRVEIIMITHVSNARIMGQLTAVGDIAFFVDVNAMPGI